MSYLVSAVDSSINRTNNPESKTITFLFQHFIVKDPEKISIASRDSASVHDSGIQVMTMLCDVIHMKKML